LTPEQIESTLAFLLLSTERTVKMTQAYYDYGVMEQLLEERERDLELAARIGQTLLEKNRQLIEQVGQLEDAVSSYNDENSQLKHSLALKDDLIKGSEEESCSTGPSTPSVSGRIFRGGYTVQEHISQLDERVNRLQVENCDLRQEIDRQEHKLCDRESEYHKLVDGTVSDYSKVSRKAEIFRAELTSKTQECYDQQEHITKLLTQLVDYQREKKQLQAEAEENLNAFEESQHAQMVLLAEFSELEKRYLETVRMLEESQCGEFRSELTNETAFASEVRELRETDQSTKNESGIFVEKTLRQQQSVDSTVETIALSTSMLQLNNSLSEVHCGIPLPQLSVNTADHAVLPQPIHPPPHPPIASGAVTPLFSPTARSSVSMMSSGISTPLMGKAGVPGSRDLERALKRLAHRRSAENRVSEERRKRASRYQNKLHSELVAEMETPPRFESSPADKLKIIKPLEGSPLMHQWRYMAQKPPPTTPEKMCLERPEPIGQAAKPFRSRSNMSGFKSSSTPERARPMPPSSRLPSSPVSSDEGDSIDSEYECRV